jgi:hypothetical protein
MALCSSSEGQREESLKIVTMQLTSISHWPALKVMMGRLDIVWRSVVTVEYCERELEAGAALGDCSGT